MTDIGSVLAAVALLLLLSVLASKATRRLGVPVLLVFMGIGMLTGSEGLGGIEFSNFELAQNVGIAALALVLFAGGLDTDMDRVRNIIRPALSLATVGVVITGAIVGLAAHLLLDLPLEAGFLLGAIVSSTDAAAVFLVLRSQSIRLSGELQPTLELESGSNDPMAVLLTVGLITIITESNTSAADLVVLFGQQMVIGAVMGYGLAKAAVWLINRIRLDDVGLYPVLTLSLLLLIFGATAAIGGSGFLAVYLAGIVISNARIVHRHSLVQFHDAIAWLAQIVMFLVLGLLAVPSDLVTVAGQGLIIAAILVLVARPVATFIAVPTRRFSLRSKMLLSWVGLRGAVPIILATFALAENVEHADVIFNVVLFAVIISVLVQGTTVAPAARLLGVAEPLPDRPPSPLAYNAVDPESDIGIHEFVISETSAVIDIQLLDANLPADALILLVSRGGSHFVPDGSTILEAGDRALVLAPEPIKTALGTLLEQPPDRP